MSRREQTSGRVWRKFARGGSLEPIGASEASDREGSTRSLPGYLRTGLDLVERTRRGSGQNGRKPRGDIESLAGSKRPTRSRFPSVAIRVAHDTNYSGAQASTQRRRSKWSKSSNHFDPSWVVSSGVERRREVSVVTRLCLETPRACVRAVACMPAYPACHGFRIQDSGFVLAGRVLHDVLPLLSCCVGWGACGWVCARMHPNQHQHPVSSPVRTEVRRLR